MLDDSHFPLTQGFCGLQIMVWDPDINKAISHVLEIEKEIQANMKIEACR